MYDLGAFMLRVRRKSVMATKKMLNKSLTTNIHYEILVSNSNNAIYENKGEDMKRQEVTSVTFADKLTIQSHEGVISSSLTVHVDSCYGPSEAFPARVIYAPNKKETWDWVKSCLDKGIPVYRSTTCWTGAVKIIPWQDSASYICRYAK